MTPWSKLRGHFQPPGLAQRPAMIPPYSSLVAGYSSLAWPGASYDSLGHSPPLQHLHEDSDGVSERLYHHLGGAGRQPLTDQGYVMK